MLGSSDFQRVKNLWQTRIGRSKSSESASSQEVPALEATTPLEPEQEYRESVVDKKVEPATPHTPALDANFHRYTTEGIDVPVTKFADLDDATPVSPASSSSTSASADSPSSSPEKPAANPVTSMFRTFSDACVFPSIMSKPPPVPAASSTSSSVSSTLLSFAPPIPTPWRSSRSSSDSTSNSSSSTFSFASVSLASALPPREAAENAINNVHHMNCRCRVSSSISRGSPYGELIVVDILEARGLAIDRDESGADLPFAVTMQLGRMSRKTRPANRDTFLVNERFVFWLQSSPTIDKRTLDIFVHGSDERDLGEVHLSLAMPVNEAFADWYPLVCRADGVKHGSMRVAMRRVVLTSSPMLSAAKTLGERETTLSFSDSRAYGELLPELWSCFPGAEPEVVASSPSKEDDISSKLGRLIGFQDVQRDVF